MQTKYLAITILFWVVFQIFAQSKDSSVPSAIVPKETGTLSDTIKADTLKRAAKSKVPDTTTGLSIKRDTVFLKDTLVKGAIVSPDTVIKTPVLPKNSNPETVKKVTQKVVKASKTQPTPVKYLKKLLRIFVRYAGMIFFLVFIMFCIVAAVLYTRKRSQGSRFMTLNRLSVMDTEVQIACQYIEDNFQDRSLTRDAICAALVTGPAFLEALFHRELGMTVDDFIAQVRIHKAKHIVAGNRSAAKQEILQQTGFSDYNQFLFTFTGITGVAFDQYLESLGDGANNSKRH